MGYSFRLTARVLLYAPSSFIVESVTYQHFSSVLRGFVGVYLYYYYLFYFIFFILLFFIFLGVFVMMIILSDLS